MSERDIPIELIELKENLNNQDNLNNSVSYIEGILDTSDIFNALPFYVLLVDEEHNILYANSAVKKHLNVEPEEIIGGYCPKVIHGTDGPFHGCPLEEAVEKMQSIQRDVYDTNASCWFQSSIYPTEIVTEQEHKVFLHMVTDITDRKRAEEQLKDSHEKLRRLSTHLEKLEEEERKKIARDLHDDTAQLLASMTAHLEAATKILPESESKVIHILKNVETLSSNVIESLQKLTYELRPLVLDDLGLVAAIDWLIENNLKTAEIRASFKKKGHVKRLEREIERVVFRVIQEAVSNIVRHSRANSAEITLNFMKKTIKVTIKDNGQGFNLAEAINSKEGLRGLGLLSMRERVEIVSGTFDIDGSCGTKIDFSIPLK